MVYCHAVAFASCIRSFGLLVAAVLIASACGTTSTESITGPDAPKCSVTLIAPEVSMGESGGAGSITVATQPECAWTAAAEASWITNLIPSQGQETRKCVFKSARIRAGPHARAPSSSTISARSSGKRHRHATSASPCRPPVWRRGRNGNYRHCQSGGLCLDRVERCELDNGRAPFGHWQQ